MATADSEWLGIATQIVANLQGYGDLRMALVTGSVARGLSDDASDLDVYLYWTDVDRQALLSSRRLGGTDVELVVAFPTPSGVFEKYRSGGRFLDVESVAVGALDALVDACHCATPFTDEASSRIAGLRDAVPMVGAEELDVWRQRLVFTDDLARHEVAMRCPRLLPPRALWSLTYERGDTVSFSARLSRLLLDAVALLGAANREFVPVGDPKWVPWHLSRLEHVPSDFAGRSHVALTLPTEAAMADIDLLLRQTLDIIDVQVPGATTVAGRFVLDLFP